MGFTKYDLPQPEPATRMKNIVFYLIPDHRPFLFPGRPLQPRFFTMIFYLLSGSRALLFGRLGFRYTPLF